MIRPLLWMAALFLALPAATAADLSVAVSDFPPPIESYDDTHLRSLGAILKHRIDREPFNLIATGLFGLAILHTFLTARFRRLAHQVEDSHKARWWAAVKVAEDTGQEPPAESISIIGRLLHFLGEVEVVFGLWAAPLLVAMLARLGQETAVAYVERHVQFTEAIFVVIIMALASTRPMLELAERSLRSIAMLGQGTPAAWWFSILTVGPLLGSFITEPGAMTISAILLGRHFYRRNPSARLAYATLGLLFVNVSIGGTLTHFAAPPVLMVASKWGWDLPFMLTHFGWQSAVAIVAATALTFLLLRRDFAALTAPAEADSADTSFLTRRRAIPEWLTIMHLLAMAWTVLNAHHPVLLVGGFLFFLAFHAATEDYQSPIDLRGPILVGFFLAGLVIHGGLQQWWIAPALGGLGEWPLFLAAGTLTAFNDNAAITYLATLVPGLTAGMKHAVMAGAVACGGLTVIANAPNPAGQSILARYFPNGVSPLGLAAGALGPTLIAGACLMLLR